MAGLKVTGMFLTTVCVILVVNECQSLLNYQQIWDGIKHVDEESNIVQLSELHRNVTLLLGNSNSGKSTFAQWITGDNLISQQSDGEFLIKHRNGSAISSHTIFPELVIGDTNAAFYDTPTFTFNIPRSHSIEGSYFLKTVLDHVQNLKIVMVVNYSMLKQGGADSFASLLGNVTKFVKNIDKFKNCVGVVVTRVDEHATTDSVVEFLRNAETSMYDDALKLSNILLQKNEQGQYPKLGVFRKPDKSGPLSEMVQFQLDKKSVKKMVDALEFAQKGNDDFEFITGNSSNDRESIANDIDDRIRDDVSELVRKVENDFENLFSRMNETKNELLENSEADVDENAQNFINEIETGKERISAVIEELNEVFNITDVSRIIVNGFNTTAFKNDVEKIRVSFDYLSLFRQKTVKPWSYLFKPILRILSSKKQQFEKDSREELRKINKNNEKLMRSIGNAVEDYYRAKINHSDIEKIISQLEDGSNMLSKWVNKTCDGNPSWYTLPEQIRTSKFMFDSPSVLSDVNTFRKNVKYFMFLRMFGGVPFDICNSSWVSPLLKTKRNLDSLHGFMVSVRDLYRKLSEYDIQGYKKNFPYVNYMDSVEKLQNFLNNIQKFSYPPTNFTLSATNELLIKVLNDLLNKTLGREVSYNCSEPDTLIVRGDFIKFSDFIEQDRLRKNKCNFKLARLNVLALKAVFIDRDIKKHGWQLSIIAPVWYIIGSREINLDGVEARVYKHAWADNGTCRGCRGTSWGRDGDDGLAGLPGGPGGNFLGIGQKFNNFENLTISARGGPGGPGQYGGHGELGKNGSDACFFDIERKYWYQMLYEYRGCRKNCEYLGEGGYRGGNGGHGGVGGPGGRGGNITLISLDGSITSYSMRRQYGKMGIHGIGGKGALGGWHGRHLFFHECNKENGSFFCSQEEKLNGRNRAESGRNGIPGVSTIDLQQPKGKEPPSIADNVRGYKHYLRQNLHDYFKTSSLLEFTNALDNNPEIQNTDDYQALLNEFLDLEKQDGDQRLYGYFITFYASLLERTNQYAENPKDYDQSNTEALKNLATRIDSKLSD